MRTRRKTPLETDFIYLGNKEIYCIFKTCCMISFIIHKMSFINYIFFCSNNTNVFLQTLGQNLNTHPVRLKVKEATCQGY